MSQETTPGKRYLGKGRARDFKVNPGEQIIEQGGVCFAVTDEFFCPHCEGSGCKSCGWSGERKKK